MRKSLKKLVPLTGLLLVATATIMWGCREDVFVEPPPSLIGEYQGIYTFQLRDGLTVVESKVQGINWVFTTSTYRMRWDTTVVQAGVSIERQFCDVDGFYELVSGVELEVDDPNVTQVVCTEGDNPSGFFTLIQQGDSVRLVQELLNETTGITTVRRLAIVPIP